MRRRAVMLLGALAGSLLAAVPVATRDGGNVVLQAGPRPPSGLVRLDGRALRDDDGVFNPLGASLFWLAWGYRFDRPRLERNLQVLADAGVDYVRALGDVGPGSGWHDREIDPRWPDYEATIRGATDLAYEKYGLRVQWTIFGGSSHVPSAADRAALVERFARIARDRPERMLALEIANEARRNAFPGDAGLAEVRALGRRLAAGTEVLVALSDPGYAPGSVCAMYADAEADIATLHYERGADEGRWQPVWRPWDWPAAFEGRTEPPPAWACPGALPPAVLNNEPIGPQASVRAEHDPLRLVLAYVTSFVAQNAAYVFHAGPGIRGGGAEDRRRGRAADFDELPRAREILAGLEAARTYLPPGLANWTRSDLDGSGAPLRGLQAAVDRRALGRALMTSRDGHALGVLLDLRERIDVEATRPGWIEVIDPMTGDVLARHRGRPGMTVAITPRREDGDGLIVRLRPPDAAP